MKFTITHLKGSRAGETQELQGEVVTIGRDPGNTLAFDPVKDDQASSFHANLVVQGGQVVLTDLGSRNGTYLNSHRISGPTPVPPGGVIQFGDKGPTIVLTFGGAAPAAAPPAAARPGPAPAPAAAPPTAAVPAPAAAKPAAPAAPAAAPAAPAAPAPAAGAKPGGPGCKACAVVGAFLLACVLGTVAVAAREQIAKVVPPGLMTYVQKIPGLDKLFKVPAPPRLPPGVPVPSLPKGSTEAAPPATTDGKAATTEAAPPATTDGKAATTEAPPATTDGKKQ